MRLLSFNRTRFPLWLGLVVLVVSTVWLERLTRAPEPAPRALLTDEPDFVATTAHLLQYDLEGRPHYTLEADRITHTAQQRATLLYAPKLTSEDAMLSVSLQSHWARIEDNGQALIFTEAVRLRQTAEGQAQPRLFETETLHFFPNSKTLHAPGPVLLTQGGSRIRADTLHADKALGLIELEGRVQAVLLPHSLSPP